MNKNKLFIIFIILLSFFVIGGGCFSYFYFNKDKEFNFSNFSEKDVLKIAKRDISIFFQKLSDYEQKVVAEKNIDQENIDKNVKFLQIQGIWGELNIESDYKEYLDAVKSSQKTFQLQLDELLKKVKKEKNLESFHQELEKLGEEYKKKLIENMEKFIKLSERIQEEVERMPFLAGWIGVRTSAFICPIISLYILGFLREIFSCENNEKNEGNNENKEKEDINKKAVERKKQDPFFLMLICFPLQFLIFPLINCLLSLKISSFKEIYKHYFNNNFKLFFFLLLFIFLNYLLGIKCHLEKYKD